MADSIVETIRETHPILAILACRHWGEFVAEMGSTETIEKREVFIAAFSAGWMAGRSQKALEEYAAEVLDSKKETN